MILKSTIGKFWNCFSLSFPISQFQNSKINLPLIQPWSQSRFAFIKNIPSLINAFTNFFLSFQRHVNSFPAFYTATAIILFRAFFALNKQ